MNKSCLEVEEICCYKSLANSTDWIEPNDWHRVKEWKESVFECYAQELLTAEMRDNLLELMALKT